MSLTCVEKNNNKQTKLERGRKMGKGSQLQVEPIVLFASLIFLPLEKM